MVGPSSVRRSSASPRQSVKKIRSPARVASTTSSEAGEVVGSVDVRHDEVPGGPRPLLAG